MIFVWFGRLKRRSTLCWLELELLTKLARPRVVADALGVYAGAGKCAIAFVLAAISHSNTNQEQG
jgi:hypothetical protein